MVSQAQKLAVRKYRRNNYETVSFEVRKGLREEYKKAATELGLSLAEFFKQAAEAFGPNHAGEVMTHAQMRLQPTEQFSAEEKKLVEEFKRLPADAQKSLLKFLRAIMPKISPNNATD